MEVIDRNRIVKNMILLYARLVFTMLIGLYTSRIVLQALGVVDFGVYNVVSGVVVMFTFISGPLTQSTRRFLTFELGAHHNIELRKVLSTSFYIHLIFAFLVLFVVCLIGKWVVREFLVIPVGRQDAALYVLLIAAVSTLFSFIRIPFEADVIAHEHFSFFAFISIFESIAKLFAVLLIVKADDDKLIVYALLILVVHILTSSSYFLYCRKNFLEARSLSLYDGRTCRKMLSLIGWSMFGGFTGMLNNQGTNILLNVFYGPAVNAARGVAFQVQSILSTFCRNIQQAINPQITKTYASKEYDSMHHLVYISSKASYLLMFTLSLPVFFYTDFILTIWLGEYPPYTVGFVRVVLFVNLFETLANPLVNSVMATGKIKNYQLVVETILLLALPVSYIYLKYVNSSWPGVVYVFLLVMAFVGHIARIYIVLPTIDMKCSTYIKNVILPLIEISTWLAAIGVICSAWVEADSFMGLICFLALIVMASVFSSYVLVLDQSEKKLVKSWLGHYQSALTAINQIIKMAKAKKE